MLPSRNTYYKTVLDFVYEKQMIVFFNLVNELYRYSFLAGYSSDRNESQTELLLAE